jgi:uncharacterized protein involved in exopolysaccharide biosynthesis
METSASFDLNRRLQEWRAKLSGTAAMPKDQLDELEDHVRTSFTKLQAQGLAADEAFLVAVRRVGSNEVLARESLKSNPQRLVISYLFQFFFAQKWIVLVCTALGLLAAVGVYLFHAPPFQSESALFIRYVMENSSPGLPGADSKAVSPYLGGESIINTEVEILRSMDLAYAVTDVIGMDKILRESKGPKDRDHAAAEVRSDLDIRPLPQSGVIRLVYSHPDPAIPQPALSAVVEAYLKKHVEVHRGAGSIGDFLSQETDQLRSRLSQTEDELRQVKDKAGIISLDTAKDAAFQQEGRIQQEILSAQTDLAENQTILEETAKLEASGIPSDERVAQVNEVRRGTIRVKALESRIKFLNSQLDQVRIGADKVDQLEGTIAELQRQKELDETNYKYYSTHLESTRIDEALGSGHALNIAIVQSPTPPFVDWSGTVRLMVLLGAGGIVFGVMWALLNEFFLKRLLRGSNDEPPHFTAGSLREPLPVQQG